MYVYNNGSVLLTELVPYGTLLDLSNKMIQALGNVRKEALVRN